VERVLFRILGPDAELEDLMHDVFVVALTALDQLRDPNALRAWVVSIAVRKAKKLIHRRTRWRFIRSVAPSDLPDREAPTASTEVSEALRSTYRVLERLPADERVVFALRHIDGMRLAAIAEACGISLATTKRRLTRAHDRFVDLARGSDVLSAWLATEELAP
jgi:RNA polymerase sigma-70 factor (ECF subfamily)